MNPSSIVVLALCGLFVLISNGLSYLRPAAAGAYTKPIYIKIWLVVGVMMLLVAGGLITTLRPTIEQIRQACGVFAIMLGGMIGKWVWDASLRTPFRLDAIPLMQALVVSPLVVLATWKTFESASTLNALLMCFSNGFFWQTIFSDLRRRKELQH